MSVFDLKTSVDQLESMNQSTSRVQYDQKAPTRDVTQSNFPNGAIHFKWENSGNKWSMPSKTYLKTRFKLTKPGLALPLDINSGIAPNMGIMSNLFQSGEFRINDKVISRVADFMPQISALDVRLNKSKAWLDSMGKISDFWSPSQKERAFDIAYDGEVNGSDVFRSGTTLAQADIPLGLYDAGTTVAYTAATGLVTFAGAGPSAGADTNVGWAVGDYITLTGGATVTGVNTNVPAKVLVVNASKLMTVEAVWPADMVAGLNTFTRTRYVDDVVPARRCAQFETIYQPPLSIFKVDHALPAGNYELVLNPQTATTWKKRAIESLLGVASKSAGSAATDDYDIEIVDMYLYVNTLEGPRADNITYLLDLEQTRCQAEQITNASFGQKNADISPSTYAITVAYQDSRVGEHTALSSSKFRSYEDGATPSAPQELQLTRQFISYAGQQMPSPDADPSFVAATSAVLGVDYTTQCYIRSSMDAGSYLDNGGVETLQEWQSRGAYYHYAIPRDGTDKSTRLTVHSGFLAGTDVVNLRVLMFDHSKMIARVVVSNGKVMEVVLEDA